MISDLILEELTTEIGLDDLISTDIDGMYYDSDGDILYFEQLLNEDTSSNVSQALLPTESYSLVPPLSDPKQIYLREAERFDQFFSLTQSGGKTSVMETPSFSSHHMPSPRPAAYSPKERYYEKDSAETGPLRVIVYGYNGLPIQPVAPPSPDYVPGPEHPPGPASTAASPDYVADSDPKEDLEEDPDDDQADYPVDGGDGDDEPSDDDDTNDEDPEEEPFEEDDEEEEEHQLLPTLLLYLL
nr:hypothetical protein [Tanacetum cinerariifolium]